MPSHARRATGSSRSSGSHSAASHPAATASAWDGETIDPRWLERQTPLAFETEDSRASVPSPPFTAADEDSGDFEADYYAPHLGPASGPEEGPLYPAGSDVYGAGVNLGGSYGFYPTEATQTLDSDAYSTSVYGLPAYSDNYLPAAPQADIDGSNL